MELGVKVEQKGLSLTLIVQVSLGSAEGIGKFEFGVWLLCAEEIGLLLDPTEPARVVQKGPSLQRYCPHQHPVLSCE